MNGTAEGLFSPDLFTTRAMIVTVLWRLSGSPVVNYYMPFADVDQAAWYAEAVRWAASCGIIAGYVVNFLKDASKKVPSSVQSVFPILIIPVVGTMVTSLLMWYVIGVPIGLLTAVFLSKAADPKLRTVVVTAIELLSGIPSVVFGLLGMQVLVPAVAKAFGKASGACLLSAIVVLSIMILPSIVSVSVTALNAVPPEYEQGSLALGATDTETWFKISIPAAKSGIAAGVVLGIGRAIGEAMAVMMVAGNSPNMPDSLFRSVTLLTTAIAKEMSYAGGLQRQALFSIALVLFVFIMLINVVLNVVLKGGNRDE